jgi:acetyl-CoA synthetase
MSQELKYRVRQEISESAHINELQYDLLYRQSIEQPELFWAEQANKYLFWFKKWERVTSYDFQSGEISWFEGGKINASYNCLDRHLEKWGDQIAIIWEDDTGFESRQISYIALHEEVCRFGNVLKSRGVEKGDRVSIYMPMIPETTIAMLACARIGAVHSVVFGGFSPDALRDRILDSDCQVVITADEGPRGGRNVPLKANVEMALKGCPDVHTTVVVRRTGNSVPENLDRDVDYYDAISAASKSCPPEELDSEDPLFILYTSGSTGTPKGVVHTNGGYQLYTAMTHQLVFDYHPGQVYWCTADIGWVTGHSYVVYGPLLNGATTVMYEGIPNWPDFSRFWKIVDKYAVNIFYTAPTAIRALMAQGDSYVKSSSRESLRILGTVGEPINPEAWEWYYRVVGGERCPVVDTWWQTETGGILITPLPGATTLKPGSATKPFFGVEPALLDNDGVELDGEASGNLVIKRSWPGQMRTVYRDHDRFLETYFSRYPGSYMTGDGARRDSDGFYWITGRVDDVINVSGHRMGTAEVESALVLHEHVAEAAVVGFPHDLKGQGIFAYVTVMTGVEPTDMLREELISLVRKEIGPIASPEIIQWAPGLPKTRSGKIMRRILKKIAANDFDDLGDISTLADSSVIPPLIETRKANS